MKIFGIAGFSGSGKTTLIERVVPLLTARGLTVSLIKRAHHEFDVDQPGKDSYLHREAGAHEVLVASAARWALLHEHRGAQEPSLQDLLGRLAACDLVLVEGFKGEVSTRLEVYRSTCGQTPLAFEDDGIRAVATDDAAHFASRGGLRCLPLDDEAAVLDYVLALA